MSDLTNKGHVKAHDNAYRKIVEAVVVAVHLHEEEGTYEICTFYVIVPRSKRLQPRQDFVDSVTEVHKVRVVFGRVVHSVVQSLQRRPCTIVRKIATVV